MRKLTYRREKEGKEMAMFFELFLMGVGLAMDAFAVSICKGLGMSKVNKKQTVEATVCLRYLSM